MTCTTSRWQVPAEDPGGREGGVGVARWEVGMGSWGVMVSWLRTPLMRSLRLRVGRHGVGLGSGLVRCEPGCG